MYLPNLFTCRFLLKPRTSAWLTQLDVEPAQYFVVVTKREKRACHGCEAGGVVSAPIPPRIIEKGLASDRIVIDTVVNKYCDHLPLYRQSAMLERDTRALHSVLQYLLYCATLFLQRFML